MKKQSDQEYIAPYDTRHKERHFFFLVFYKLYFNIYCIICFISHDKTDTNYLIKD